MRSAFCSVRVTSASDPLAAVGREPVARAEHHVADPLDRDRLAGGPGRGGRDGGGGCRIRRRRRAVPCPSPSSGRARRSPVRPSRRVRPRSRRPALPPPAGAPPRVGGGRPFGELPNPTARPPSSGADERGDLGVVEPHGLARRRRRDTECPELARAVRTPDRCEVRERDPAEQLVGCERSALPARQLRERVLDAQRAGSVAVPVERLVDGQQLVLDEAARLRRRAADRRSRAARDRRAASTPAGCGRGGRARSSRATRAR